MLTVVRSESIMLPNMTAANGDFLYACVDCTNRMPTYRRTSRTLLIMCIDQIEITQTHTRSSPYPKSQIDVSLENIRCLLSEQFVCIVILFEFVVS